MRDTAALLSAWSSFYVMIGSSAAGLTGLMFVVISLTTENNRGRSRDGVSAFTTPSVVHFSCALFASALMSAPFRSLTPIAIIFGLAGLSGLIYIARVAVLASRLSNYRPDAEDWTFNVILPALAYATVAITAIMLRAAPSQSLFALAGAIVLLVFVGIHNAWDVVTFFATGKDKDH